MKCDSDATIYLKLIGIAAYLLVMVVLTISGLRKKYVEKRQIKTLAMLFGYNINVQENSTYVIKILTNFISNILLINSLKL